MSSRTPTESGVLRRSAVRAAAIGAVAVASLALASPAQAKNVIGGPVSCPTGQTVAIYTTGTVGEWSHLAYSGYDTVRRSGTTSTPTIILSRTTFQEIDGWRVSADHFDRAGARCI
ncbi:hypothetical protein GCM10029992_24760 [Glycomyces albus]